MGSRSRGSGFGIWGFRVEGLGFKGAAPKRFSSSISKSRLLLISTFGLVEPPSLGRPLSYVIWMLCILYSEHVSETFGVFQDSKSHLNPRKPKTLKHPKTEALKLRNP